MAHSSQGLVIPTSAAVLMAALLAGCRDDAPPREAPRFEWTVITQEPVMGNARTGVMTDRHTGCLYSFVHEKGVSPIIAPDGKQAGCRPATTALETGSVGIAAGDAPNAPSTPGTENAGE